MTRNLTRATRASLVAVIASTALIMTAPIASAAGCYSGTAEGDYCYTSAAGESTIVGYIGTSVNVNIPGTLGGLPVTTIGPTAFYDKSLETVTIADSVTAIGDNAFRQNSIISVTLPNSLVTLDLGAFDMNAITSVTLPEGTAVIGPYAFANNRITSVTIPSSVTSIDNSAFASNVLTTVTMGGDEPAPLGTTPFGSVSVGNNPLVTFAVGKTYTHGVPGVWNAGGTNYRLVEPVTVTFVTAVGAAPATVHPMAYIGTADPGVLTADGYRFDGWYTAASGGSLIGLPVTVTGDMTLYAYWTSLFNVTYTTAHSVAPESVVIPDGGTLASPGSLTATGYRFDGWYTAASGGTTMTFPLTVTADTTIYAHWTSLFNVTYTTAHSVAPESVVIPDGGTLANPGPLAATGYRFDGWYTAASGGTTMTFPLTVTADTTIYAHWTSLFNVTYTTAHSVAPESVVIPDGGTLAGPGSLTATGYRFDGWYDAASGGAAVAFPLTVTADTDIYAHWTRMYAVSYTTALSVAPSATTVPTGSSLADPGALVAAGYRFDGWFDVASGGTAVTFPLTVTADTQLFAHWTSLFNVRYTTAHSVAPGSVVIPDGDTVTDPGPLTATGYRFDGWYHAASGGTAVTFPLTVTADTNLYAHWTSLFHVTYIPGWELAPTLVVIPDGDTVADPGSLTATGYRFDGWYLAPTGGAEVTFPLTITSDTSLYAHWTSLFNVTYTTAHSVAPTSVVIPDGGTLASPGSLTATGYRFDGWFTAASGGATMTFPLTVTADTTIYAHWTQLFTATFSSPEGTAPSAAVVAIGDTLSDPGPLTADVHRFEGWYDAPTGGHPVTFPLTVAADTAIYAQWEARDVIAPASADAGTTIAVTGTGFEPGESVAIELHSDPVLLGTVIANSSGAISGTFTIPASVPAGSHSLVLTGSVTGVSSEGITIGGPLAFTGTNPVPLGLGAIALVGIGIGLILRRRATH